MPKENQTKPLSISFKQSKDNATVKFNTPVDHDNFGVYYDLLIQGFATAYLNLLTHVNMLRPATAEERDLHCYVFKTDDKDDSEHHVYALREKIYNHAKDVFNELLQTTFPDIEYLEQCRDYQQNYFFEDYPNKDDYTKAVKELAAKVRESYDSILEQCYGKQKKEETDK